MKNFPKMVEIPLEGFTWSEWMKDTENGPEKWAIDWFSKNSQYNISYYYEDDIYYVKYGAQRKDDVPEDHRFKDLESAANFVREKEKEEFFEGIDEA